jgi:hypothetical protein
MTSILSQTNHEETKIPFSFMSWSLQDYEFKYSPIKKQAFVFVKSIAHLRTYIILAHVLAYVLLPLVKMMLIHPLRDVIWYNWLEKFQDYDLESRPLKAIKW